MPQSNIRETVTRITLERESFRGNKNLTDPTRTKRYLAECTATQAMVLSHNLGNVMLPRRKEKWGTITGPQCGDRL